MTAQLFPEPDGFEIPAFLRRTTIQPGETTMPDTQTPAATEAAKKRKKTRDAYIVRGTITVPLDTSDPQSYANAVTAIGKITSVLPEGSTFESEARIGKIGAA